jgi:nitrogen-specific signal transduction histidine kinase
MQSLQSVLQDKTEFSCLNIALVGGGSGGRALIRFVETHRMRNLHLCIVGVADLREDAAGVVYARKKGIYTTTDYRDFFSFTDLHLLIEITGREDVLEEIMRSKPKEVKVIDHLSARLFWDLIEVQEEKISCEKKLAHSSRLATVGRMASYLAHEIRNPLVSIGGFATVIQNSPELPASLRPKVEIIVNEVRRLEAVLKNMRDFIRPLKQNKGTYNYNELVVRAHDILQPECKTKGLELSLDLDSHVPDSLFDMELMLEALVTITRRLMQSLERNEKLSLQTELCWDTVGIYLLGKGGWIPADELENMFNPFADEQCGTTGLDMAMSKKIIDDHGGEIKIVSEASEGTAIVTELPLENVGVTSEVAEVVEGQRYAGNRQKDTPGQN